MFFSDSINCGIKKILMRYAQVLFYVEHYNAKDIRNKTEDAENFQMEVLRTHENVRRAQAKMAKAMANYKGPTAFELLSKRKIE